jgi:N-acetylneuraminic acid mutarotase
MSKERACFSHIVIDNKVYVYGGISGNSKTKNEAYVPIVSEPNTERYDPKLNKWEKIDIKNSPSLGAFSWSKLNEN